ncbi:hypothetical protein QCA50_005685 [Cerrena zonata]|uniref:DUF6593 domain-containing protein n=1 Tax=Cerrena zonata TaxID=2478898 RepID=A0AAW0GFW3_9APHY
MASSDEDVLSLIMTPNVPVNTTLATEDGKVYYTIFTEHGKTSRTQVRNAHEEIIASLEWRDTLPDKVTFGRNKPVSIWDWMKKSVIPFKHDLTFQDEQGRQYRWKGNSVGRSLELSALDTEGPIAFFHASRRSPNPGGISLPPIWTEAKLNLNARAREIQDLVVASFLFIEKTRRENENTSLNAADVRGASVFRALLTTGGVGGW